MGYTTITQINLFSLIWTKTYNFRKKVYGIHSDEGEFRDEQILVDFKYCEEKRDYQTKIGRAHV